MSGLKAAIGVGLGALVLLGVIFGLAKQVRSDAATIAGLERDRLQLTTANALLVSEAKANRAAWQTSLEAVQAAQQEAATSQKQLADALNNLGDTDAELKACLRRDLDASVIERLPQ